MDKCGPQTQMSNPAHMSRFERSIPGGGEWHLGTSDWVVLHLSQGIAYVFDRRATQELPAGGVIVCPPKSDMVLTASVLGAAVFRGIGIRTSSLTGLLTALERQSLEAEVARECAPFLSFAAEHPLAKRVTLLLGQEHWPSLASRLALVQTFAEIIGPHLVAALHKGMEDEKNQQDAKGRLRQIISEIPESELCDLSLGEMAKMLHCCERHASRLFREEWGTGFLSYVSEVRLKKACDLLLEGRLKIIDVALESGHGSLGHFNYVFKKRFRMTPTKWRERRTAPPPHPTRHPPRAKLAQMAGMLAGMWLCVAVMSGGAQAAGTGDGGTNQAPAAPATNAAAAAAIKFAVDRYEVRGNTLLPSNLISRVLAPFTGEAVGTNTVAKAMGALKMEYFDRGFITVTVTVPPQQVTNRVILMEVTEGRLETVKILHNRYFSSNNIMAALPYVKTLESGQGILNKRIFEGELDRANSNPDRQILSEVKPGLDPGTSALILNVNDRLPLHGRLEWDNYSPPGTPDLRVNANLSYANLWQLDHTLGVQYGFSPEETKPSLGPDTHIGLNPLDGPEVAYYSGFYRAPLGAPAAVEEQIAQDQTHFGYNETTRQFVLPPAIGRPEFSAYVSRSTTGPTIFGPELNVVNSSLLSIEEQLISQQYTSQTTAGGRLSFPLPAWNGLQSTWSFGMDYKQDKVVTLPTNYFFYATRVSHGVAGGITTVNSSIAIGGVGTYPSLEYTPLYLGWNGSRQDHWGSGTNRWSQFNGGISMTAGTGGTFSREKAFPILIANTPEATTEFVSVRPQLSRTQALPDNCTFYGSMSGQWANVPLLNLEQFELGGNGSVRGYREGEFYSDTGWVGQAELRSPIYWRGPGVIKRFGTQFTAFTDYGQGYELDQGAKQNAEQDLWGAGVGLNLNLGPHVEGHIMIAWPLRNSAFTAADHERISFSLSAQL